MTMIMMMIIVIGHEYKRGTIWVRSTRGKERVLGGEED
jgi:hypothetical protein